MKIIILLYTLPLAAIFSLPPLAFAQSLPDSYAEAAFTCSDLGGGYRIQNFSFRIDRSALHLEVERWYPFDNSDALNVADRLVKSLNVSFPIESCLFKPADVQHVELFRCHTGISDIEAKITKTDGSSERIILPDNFSIEGIRRSKMTVSTFSDEEIFSVLVDAKPQQSVVGFNIKSCR